MTDLRTAAQAVIDNYELRHKFDMDVLINDLRQALAAHDNRKPIAWEVETKSYGKGYAFSNEFLEAFPRFPLPPEPVEPAAWWDVDALIDVLAETPFRKTLGDSQWQATFTDQQLDIINNAVRARGQK